MAQEPEARKIVTVVFTDVAGSTALGEQLDPELLRSVMWRYFDAVQGALERHGGSVEKFIGDAVMAVFGVPVVHEDDPLRAVRAAAARTARSASSSCATGTPKTAMTASPTNFSTVPPCRSRIARSSLW